jgi:tRNA threonylcarbamoyladenosine biosynthesis protein TsaE
VTVVSLPTADDTRQLGRRLADVLRAGDLVILDGPLGAGKTVLVQGIGAGLGVQGTVTSPTFVIARVHQPAPGGRGIPLVHVDAYRLNSLAEVDDLDLDTGLEQAVTVVEWGEGKVERLAEAHLLIRLRRPSGDEGAEPGAPAAESVPGSPEGHQTRTAELIGVGGDWEQRLAGLTEEPAERPERASGSSGRAG